MRTLTRGEKKALALHRAIASRLRDDPSLRLVAKRRLDWLRARNPDGGPYYDRWVHLLERPLEHLIEAMLDPSDAGCALRQESPFVDIVDQRERARIFRDAARDSDADRQP